MPRKAKAAADAAPSRARRPSAAAAARNTTVKATRRKPPARKKSSSAARKAGAAPGHLDTRWTALWIRCRDQLVKQGTWLDTDEPQLDQYIDCLRAAETARTTAAEDPFVDGSQEQLVAHPGFRLAEQLESRALKYAQALLLTAAARARHKLGGDRGGDDPLEGLLNGDDDG